MAEPLNTAIPTTNVWDPSQIYEVEGISEPLSELLVRMYQNLNQMSLAINAKDAGYYLLEEFVNGQQFFADPADTDQTNYRPDFRRAVNFGALPAAGSKSVAHSIAPTADYIATRVYGAATNPTAGAGTPFFIPIPYSSATAVADNLELYVTDTNVVITTGGTDYSAFTQCVVVIEYIKK